MRKSTRKMEKSILDQIQKIEEKKRKAIDKYDAKIQDLINQCQHDFKEYADDWGDYGRTVETR